MGEGTPQPDTRVAVAVMLFDGEGRFVVGERKGSLGSGTLGHPGGHLESFESFQDCAMRESLEETGLELCDVRVLTATSNIMESGGADGTRHHYVTIWVGAQRRHSGEDPQVREPEKCVSWAWVNWDDVLRWKADCQRDGQSQQRTSPVLFWPICALIDAMPAGWHPWSIYRSLI